MLYNEIPFTLRSSLSSWNAEYLKDSFAFAADPLLYAAEKYRSLFVFLENNVALGHIF